MAAEKSTAIKYDGFFIAVEGIEGCGKSSIISSLASNLSLLSLTDGLPHKDVRLTQDFNENMTLFNRRYTDSMLGGNVFDPIAQAFLHAAAGREQMAKLIRPSLDSGMILITEQYTLTYRAYMGNGYGVNQYNLDFLIMLATDTIVPNITIVLDLDPAIALERIGQEDIMWRQSNIVKDIPFNRRVRNGFLEQASMHPERIIVLDASQSLAEVEDSAWAAVREKVIPWINGEKIEVVEPEEIVEPKKEFVLPELPKPEHHSFRLTR